MWSGQGVKVAQNIATGVGGLIIWQLWFGIDFQGSAGKDLAALESRQQFLASLVASRCKGRKGT